jgi:hypothetical protein
MILKCIICSLDRRIHGMAALMTREPRVGLVSGLYCSSECSRVNTYLVVLLYKSPIVTMATLSHRLIVLGY